jgi:hypothetical protein
VSAQSHHPLTNWDLGQADILRDRPDNDEAGGLGGKGIDLGGALAHEARQALDGVGGADVTMHHGWISGRCGMLFHVYRRNYSGPLRSPKDLPERLRQG